MYFKLASSFLVPTSTETLHKIGVLRFYLYILPIAILNWFEIEGSPNKPLGHIIRKYGPFHRTKTRTVRQMFSIENILANIPPLNTSSVIVSSNRYVRLCWKYIVSNRWFSVLTSRAMLRKIALRHQLSDIVFAHADVIPSFCPPYRMTASGLYPLLPCKLAKFSNWFLSLKNGIFVWDYDYFLETFSYFNFQ